MLAIDAFSIKRAIFSNFEWPENVNRYEFRGSYRWLGPFLHILLLNAPLK